jgi:subtilisin family serine protease
MPHNAHFYLSRKLLGLGSIRRATIGGRPVPARRGRSLASLSFAVMLAVGALAAPAMAQPAVTLAPVRNETAQHKIPDQYIVVFKDKTPRDTVRTAQDTIKRLGGTVIFTYTAALIGFNAKIPPQALPAVRALPGVDYIEADQTMTVQTSQPPNPNSTPPDGLKRISHRLLPLPPAYTYSEDGMGVSAYIIDSGIDVGLAEFGGRAHWAQDFSGANPLNTDCTGHGTHVAGVLGGTNFGVAKRVTLYAVRVIDCMGTSLGTVVQAVDWVIMNAQHPAVANISLGADNQNAGAAALDTAVKNLVAANVTVVVAAGNAMDDACNYTPADAQGVITVGATDPNTDTVDPNSNFGTCIKLFAPGVNILSAEPDAALGPKCTLVSNTPGARSATCSGSSEAAPHVAGVAARYLQTHPMATPADVWNAIHTADDVSTTMNWPGIFGAGPNSPNELLHWGSLNNGQNDGDPHLTTVEGIPYDFQGAGEFIVLRDGNGLEIQTRQIPVATAPPAANAYTGLATCVSVNTAVAARVGKHRVTYQPSGDKESADLQLRVDGVVTALPATGLDLGPGSRAIPLAAAKGAIEIDFADGSNLTVTPGYWQSQHTPYLNVDVFNTTATEGLMGVRAPGSWLPALPNGTSVGPLPAPMPGAAHQRFVALYHSLGSAWRVTNATTLFDYAPGTSTASFTDPNWPPEQPPCLVPGRTAPEPLSPKIAQRLCSAVTGANRKADCVFDTTITGDASFAKTYQASQLIAVNGTTTTVNDNRDPTQLGEPVTFTATVNLTVSRKAVTSGTIQFVVDGANVGAPLKLNAKGQAVLRTKELAAGNRRVVAVFAPAKGSAPLASRSLDRPHVVVAKRD